jgi:tetratricopeptide (TPR) repeat protein
MNVSRTKLAGVALAIFAATVWLYWPCVHGGFLTRMDDDEYLRQAVRLHGLTWKAMKWAFTATQPYYHPLPRLSYVLDYQMWGKDAEGHHATSVFLHALNAALVFGFLWTLLGVVPLTAGERFLTALGVSVVFAIHPLQAESVAWMSVRTQLMCATFGIICMWAHAAGARRWIVWVLYVAALACKPLAVSFPFVILAIDYFPLRRHEKLGWVRLLRENSVLVALGAVGAVVTLFTESRPSGLIVPLEAVPLSQRVLLMFQSLAFYPWKLVWPVPLSAFYPLRTGLSLGQWPILASVSSITTVTALAVWKRRRLPALTAGWCAYMVLVLPVSGLVQRSIQAVAPRYAYVAMLPLLLLASGAVIWLWRRWATGARFALVALLAGELCVFGVRTRNLIPMWHDTETLWRTVLSEFPDSPAANWSLLYVLLDQGRPIEALAYAQRNVEIEPDLAESHYDLGSVLARLGRYQEAIGQYEQALRIRPEYAKAHYGLGLALWRAGQLQAAIGHYEKALRIDPDLVEAQVNLGIALSQVGSDQEALAHFTEALRLSPDSAEVHCNLGFFLLQAGELPEAMEHFEQALRIKPDYADAHFNLGLTLEKLGRIPEAIEHYQQVLRLRPDFAPAKTALARLQTGQ